MNQKGFFFSLMTFLMLFSIIMFSASYMSRSKQLQKSAYESKVGDRLRYVEDDISAEFLYGLISVGNFEITENNSTDSISFRGGNLRGGFSHISAVNSYVSFVEQNYSALSNIEIELINVSAGFVISPYGSRYVVSGGNAALTTNDYSRLRKVRLVVSVNMSLADLASDSTPADNGDREITVELFDDSGQRLLADQVAYLDPTATNKTFRAEFNGGESLEVRFGSIEGIPGGLGIYASGLEANVMAIELNYSSAGLPIAISDGMMHIYSPAGEISKDSLIMIRRG